MLLLKVDTYNYFNLNNKNVSRNKQLNVNTHEIIRRVPSDTSTSYIVSKIAEKAVCRSVFLTLLQTVFLAILPIVII